MDKVHLSRNDPVRLAVIAVLSIMLYSPTLILAQATAQTASGGSIDDLQKMLTEQKKQLDAQEVQIKKQQDSINTQTGLLKSMQTQLDQLAKAKEQEKPATPEEIEMKERLASLESQISAIPEDPASKMGEEGFPGSLRVPGTNAAYRVGGYVKFNYVSSFDPIESKDRFIVGSIPVEDQQAAQVGANTSLNANQTRINFDLRDNSSLGQFRAFVEGDFAGDGDTFRLRHAYGQFRDVLTGKTWSTLYDPQAKPEELDFEGVNGQNILRQAQIRYFPSIGENYDLAVALEDPVTGATDYDFNDVDGDPMTFEAEATSSSDLPDLTASIRRTWFNDWHVKAAIVLRRLQAQSAWTPGLEPATTGFGASVSGVFKVGLWDERDNIKFQLTGGRGLGRYLNDPNTLGGLDAVFAPDGTLDALPIFGGYAAYQHWWDQTMRSTFLFSLVRIDNYSYQPDDAYKETARASGNFIWSPIPRVDIGTELLWGRRTNKDKNDASSLQLQLVTLYRF
jgi:TolA-binding protein